MAAASKKVKCARCKHTVPKKHQIIICRDCDCVGKCTICDGYHTDESECEYAECRECGEVLEKEDEDMFTCFFYHEINRYYCRNHILGCTQCMRRTWCSECAERRDTRFPDNDLIFCLSCDHKYCPDCAKTRMTDFEGESYGTCNECKNKA